MIYKLPWSTSDPKVLRNGRINGYVANIIYDLLHVTTLFWRLSTKLFNIFPWLEGPCLFRGVIATKLKIHWRLLKILSRITGQFQPNLAQCILGQKRYKLLQMNDHVFSQQEFFFFKFLIILKLNRLFWGLFITRNWFLDEHYGPVASWFLFSFPFLCKTTGTLIKTQIGTNHSKVKRRPHHKVSCVWKYQMTSFSLMEVPESVEVYRMGNSDTRTFFQREMIDNI